MLIVCPLEKSQRYTIGRMKTEYKNKHDIDENGFSPDRPLISHFFDNRCYVVFLAQSPFASNKSS